LEDWRFAGTVVGAMVFALCLAVSLDRKFNSHYLSLLKCINGQQGKNAGDNPAMDYN